MKILPHGLRHANSNALPDPSSATDEARRIGRMLGRFRAAEGDSFDVQALLDYRDYLSGEQTLLDGLIAWGQATRAQRELAKPLAQAIAILENEVDSFHLRCAVDRDSSNRDPLPGWKEGGAA